MNITNIQDARALKRMGLPLSTILETRYFSEAYSKQWLSLTKAHDNFCGALADYVEVTSASKWQKLRKSLNGIFRAVERSDAAVVKLTDPNEQAIMTAFLLQRAVPFAEYWEGVLNAVDNGGTLTITPADWPRWTDED